MNVNATFDDLEKLDAEHVMQTYGRLPVAFVRGEGTRLWDTEVVWSMTHQTGYPGTLVGTLSDRGIPSIVAESGYLSTYNEPEIGVPLRGARNVLRPGAENRDLLCDAAVAAIVEGEG